MTNVSDLKEELTSLLDGFEDTLDSLHHELWCHQPAVLAGGVGESYASDAGPEHEQGSGAAGPVYQEEDQQNLYKHSLLVGEHLLVAEGRPLQEKACHGEGDQNARIGSQ